MVDSVALQLIERHNINVALIGYHRTRQNGFVV
jgi:hypothetical protein